MKKLPVFLAILLIFTASPGAQTRADGDAFPHVSNIRAEVRNNLVRLTWTDSPEARGPVFIFRSTRPFVGAIPPHIRPVIVRYGAQAYIDDTDGMENLYYFIAASDTSGRPFEIIIPHTNTISIVQSAELDASEVAARVAGAIPPPVAEPAPVSNLSVSQDGDRVIITYDSAPGRNAILYRSMRPIRQPLDLLNAVIVQSVFVSPFVDYPVPGLTWYYAVLYEDEITSGNIRIRPGVNATVSAVQVSADVALQRALRPMPLPALSIRDASTERVSLRTETEHIINNMQVPQRALPPARTPRVFSIDLETPIGGEELVLYRIINDYFMQDWEAARIGLLNFLSLPRPNDIEVRARFYLAQTLYFSGNLREALLEFLFLKSHYPEEANDWIDAILSAMTR